MLTCDLHTHSYFSDGTLSPAQLISAAREAGLSAVALCDHNTVQGLPEFIQAGQGSGVTPVPGIEFSTDYQGTELHILALFVKPEHYGPIRELMGTYKQKKERSNRDLVDALNRAGYRICYEDIAASARGRINRAHIAAALLEKGYVASVQDAFQSLLSPKRGYYHPPELPQALEIIPYIKDMGAVAVLAHPFLSFKTEEAVSGFLEKAVPAGLDAMETMYPKYTPEQTVAAAALAERFGIAPSGGSDFHGQNKPDIAIGTGRGTLRVPVTVLDTLRQKIF